MNSSPTQLTASGNNLLNGPVNLYTMVPASNKFTPKDMAQDVAQLFTGIRIQCAECHNHPFDRWTMDDYYGFVSVFAGIRRKEGSEPREYYIYCDPNAPPAKHLLDERPVPRRVLGGLEPIPAGRDPRIEMARWLTAPDNPLFARNLANRIWSHFFGRGIVEPVDDLRVSNPPSNQPLLDALTAKLVEHKFSLRALVRDICNSRTYQLSATPNETNTADRRQFSRASLRRLRADILLDAMSQATESFSRFGDAEAGTRAVEFYPRNGTDYFLDTFGRSQRKTVGAHETQQRAHAFADVAPDRWQHGDAKAARKPGAGTLARRQALAAGDPRRVVHPHAYAAADAAGDRAARQSARTVAQPAGLRRHFMGFAQLYRVCFQSLIVR